MRAGQGYAAGEQAALELLVPVVMLLLTLMVSTLSLGGPPSCPVTSHSARPMLQYLKGFTPLTKAEVEGASRSGTEPLLQPAGPGGASSRSLREAISTAGKLR